MCDLCFIPRCDCDAALADAPEIAPNAAGGTAVLDAPPPTVTDALALDSTRHWAGDTVSYGFPDTADGFTGGAAGYSPYNEPGSRLTLSDFGRDTLREGFAHWNALTALTVVEAAKGDMAQINVGASSVPATAWAYYPGGQAANGDIWFNTGEWFLDALAGGPEPVIGSYAHATGMHEFGHALGLKHPHQTSGGGTAVLDPAYDGVEFSIMSYRSYPGGPTGAYTIESWGFPQSPMMLDIAMIQAIYGADYSTQAGDTTYTFSTATGETFVDGVSLGVPGANRVFRTIWDGDGTDHVDLSNYTTSMHADLNPGRGIRLDTDGTFQTARLASGTYAGFNIYMSLLHDGDTRSLIENLTTGSGDDVLIGNAAANVLASAAGTNGFTGGLGADTLVLGAGADTVADTLAGLDGDTVLGFDIARDRVVIRDAQLSTADLSLTATGALRIDGGAQTALLGLGLDPLTTALSVTQDGAHSVVGFAAVAPPPPPPEDPPQDPPQDPVTDPVADPVADQVINGSQARDTLTGGDGNDQILLRYGDDTATGGAGADSFIFDWRYLDSGDSHRITDLDFAAGDQMHVRLFNGPGGTAIDSRAALDAFIARPDVASHTAGDDLQIVLTGADGQKMAIRLDGFEPPALAVADPVADQVINGSQARDTLTGGDGNDQILLRYGDDTATGGAGADSFIFDWRYLDSGDSHRITDLDFAAGDQMHVRLFNGPGGTAIDSRATLDAFIARPDVASHTAGDDLQLTLVDDAGTRMLILIDDWA